MGHKFYSNEILPSLMTCVRQKATRIFDQLELQAALYDLILVAAAYEGN